MKQRLTASERKWVVRDKPKNVCVGKLLVIGQFNKPITFKVVVKINQSHLSCSLNQPITTLVSITIETSVQTPKLRLSSKWRIFPLNNDYILDDSGDFFYPMAQMFMRTIQTSTVVNMLTCSDELQPSTALFYIASQQPWKTEVNIHLFQSLGSWGRGKRESERKKMRED